MAARNKPARGKTRADQNRAIRQDALREQLASQKHIEHVSEMIRKLKDFRTPLEPSQIQRLTAAINGSMRLVDKYLPDLKSVEHTGEVETGLSELLAQARDLRQLEPAQATKQETPGESTTKH